MLRKDELKSVMHLATATLENKRGAEVEIYHSIDKDITGQYFGPDRDQPAMFEVVLFSHPNSDFSYVQYPDSDVYVEMKGGEGSRWGTMSPCGFRNILKEKIRPYLNEGVLLMESEIFYKHEDYAMYKFGLTNFNFLKRVAKFSKNDPTNFGEEHIEKMLSKKFIPIPLERTIAYSFITNDNNYVIVDQDAHNFQYGTMRCFYGNLSSGIKVGKISNFQRYRDGGTTEFDFTIDNKEHKFFSPTGFDKTKKPTWNKLEMTQMSDDKLALIVSELQIPLASKVEYRNY